MIERADTSNILNIVIIATSDLHGNLWGYRYEDGVDTTNDGMARVASYVREIRQSGAEVILIDNGDVFQGNMLTDDVFNKRLDSVHPVSVALNAMGYSAMTLGNHEFNFGLALIEIQAGAGISSACCECLLSQWGTVCRALYAC